MATLERGEAALLVVRGRIHEAVEVLSRVHPAHCAKRCLMQLFTATYSWLAPLAVH